MRFANSSITAGRAILAGIVLLIVASSAWSQRGIPIRVSPPVVRPTVPHVFVPHTGQSHGTNDSGDVIWTVVGVIVAIAVGVLAILGIRSWMMRKPVPKRIRIIAAPPGEAPEELRQEWIGLELPLAPGEPIPRPERTVGVLTGQPTGLAAGYIVEADKAIALLAARSAIAAEWWREAAPHVLQPGYKLSFPAEVCELVD